MRIYSAYVSAVCLSAFVYCKSLQMEHRNRILPYRTISKYELPPPFIPKTPNLRKNSRQPNIVPLVPSNHFGSINGLSLESPIDKQSHVLQAYNLSNLSPIKHTNPGGIFSLLMSGSDEELDLALSQNAFLDTVADLLSLIGLRDLRDWLGIILMMFLLGPVLIPIIFFPAPTIALGALLVPIIWNSPPSVFNDNVAGHDPRIGAGGRSFDTQTPEDNGSKCLEMLACEFRMVVRKITSPNPVSRMPGYDTECLEHYCNVIQPIQNFLSSNYLYIFGDGNQMVS